MPIDLASNKGSSKTSKICFLLEWISKKGRYFRLRAEFGQEAAYQDDMKKINRK